MPGIVKIGPVAVAKASPAEVGIGEPVTFDHSSSFHPSSDHNITLYQWDFDGDGVIDASTDNPDETFTHSYEKSCIYTAVLKVTDDQMNKRANSQFKTPTCFFVLFLRSDKL